MAEILFTVKNNSTGAVLEGVSVALTEESGNVGQTTNANGQTTFTGLTVGTAYPYTATLSGYGEVTGTVTPTSDDAATSQDVAMTATATNSTDSAANTTTTAAVTTTSTDVANYATLEAALKAAIAEVESAVEAGTLATVQTASVSLISKAKTQLTASIAYYVEQRSKLDMTVPKNWDDWLRYSSMIGGLYILRADVSSCVGKALAWVEAEAKKAVAKLSSI